MKTFVWELDEQVITVHRTGLILVFLLINEMFL